MPERSGKTKCLNVWTKPSRVPGRGQLGVTKCVGGERVNVENFSIVITSPPRNCEAWSANHSLQILQVTCSLFLHLLNYAHSITNTKQVALSFPQAHLQPHFHVSLLTLSSWEPLLIKPPSLHGKQTSLSPRTEQPHPTSTEILIPGCPADQTQNMSMNLPVPQTHIILSTPVLGFSSGRNSILTTDWSPYLNLPLLYSVLQRLPAYHSLKIKKGFITQKNPLLRIFQRSIWPAD